MPNPVVPANAGGMPRYDRAAIMRDAWKRWRWVRSTYALWQIEQGIIDASFSRALRLAWEHAKIAAEKARREAALISGPNASRAEAMRAEIDMLKYKSFQINIEPRRRALEAELASLAA